jgi:peptidoglycan hydrolase CwlO-like protein
MRNMIRVAQYAVLIVVALTLVGCGVPKSEHQALTDKFSQVQKENNALTKKNKDLEAQVARLSSANKELQAKCQELMKEKGSCEAGKTEAPEGTE